MEMLDLITLATFAAAASLIWLAAGVLLKPRRTSTAPPGTISALAGGVPDRNGPFVESLAGQLPQTLLGGEQIEKDFHRAGYYQLAAKQRFFALRNGLVVLVVLAAGIGAVAIGPPLEKAVQWALIPGLIVTIMAYALPRVVLAVRARQRVERIRDALPDALDTIGMCLYGGISLQECLEYVGQEMVHVHPDLALELLIVGQQADINSFEFAVQQFAGRIDAPEVVALASLVVQNQRLGTGIVDSVRDFADSLRLKRRQTAEAKASRAELFLLFPVVFCLVPSILLILWGPPILSLIEFIQTQTVPTVGP